MSAHRGTYPIIKRRTWTLTSPQRSEDLWNTAMGSLQEDLRADLEAIALERNRRVALETALFEARNKRQQCLNTRWKIKNRRGDVVILRDVFEKIIKWVDIFKGLGDAAISMAPDWAGIPWALVGCLLKVSRVVVTRQTAG